MVITLIGLCGVSSPVEVDAPALEVEDFVLLEVGVLKDGCGRAAGGFREAVLISFLAPLPVLIRVEPFPASFLDLRLHIWK